MNFFNDNYKSVPIEYIIQSFDKQLRNKPWGTADAVSCLNLNEPFIVCNSDEIYDKSLYKLCINHLNKCKNCAMIAYTLKNMIPKNGKVNRGIIYENNNIVYKIHEMIGISNPLSKYNLTGNELCNVNFFVFYPKILNKNKKKK